MDATMRVDVIAGQSQPCTNDTFRCMCQFDIVEQELIDGAIRLAALPEFLDMREDFRTVSRVGRHGAKGVGSDDRELEIYFVTPTGSRRYVSPI